MADIVVDVVAPTRLHFGLLNTSAFGKRVDGGAGLMLDAPNIRVEVFKTERQVVTPPSLKEEVKFCLERLGAASDIPVGVRITNAEIAHQGFGWKTQLRLATSMALIAGIGLDLPGEPLATVLGRGGTSGIGSWGFWHGGFIVDGGHVRERKQGIVPSSSVAAPELPPLLCAHRFEWPVVVAVVRGLPPIHGRLERELFAANTPTALEDALLLYECLFGEVLPAVVEGDFHAFCQGLDRVGELGFKRIERQVRGRQMAQALDVLRAAGLMGTGMSSWGPAVFGFAPTMDAAEAAVEELSLSGVFGSCLVTRASATGALVTIDGETTPALEVASRILAGPSPD